MMSNIYHNSNTYINIDTDLNDHDDANVEVAEQSGATLLL